MHFRKSSPRSLPVGAGFYAGAVTLLAVFLAGLLLLRTPVLGYRAAATIRTHDEQKPLNLAQLAAWLESDEVLTVAIDRVAGAKSLSPSMLRAALEVTSDSSVQVKSFQISLLADESALAAALVNELAQQTITSYLQQERQAAESARLSRLRGRVRAARSEEDRLRASVERLRQEQLSRVIITARIPPAESNAALPAAPAAADPRQDDLREQIGTLQVQRSVLLGNRTSEHPEVVAVDNQLQRLQAELAAIAVATTAPVPAANPLLNVPPQISPGSPTTVEVPRAAIDPQAPTDALINMAARIEEAVHQLSQSTWDRQQAEHDLELAAGNVAGQRLTWTAEPAHVVGRLGGTPTPLQMLAAGLLAAFAAGVMYRAHARASQPPPLATVEELRSTLQVPLVAELALSASAAPRRPRLNLARTVRVSTHIAEAVVAAAVALCLLSMLADQSLAGEFASDPLGAFSAVVDRLLP